MRELIIDGAVDQLEEDICSQRAKPDRRRRWTMKVIERMRVAERAARIIVGGMGPETHDEIWHDAQHKAIIQLRKEGKIR